MLTLRSPLFLICLLLFIIHQLLQKEFNLHFFWLDNYLDSLLAMPIILTLWEAEKIFLFKKDSAFRLSMLEIAAATIYISLISEVVFPLFSTAFKGDWIDVIFYVGGSSLFYLYNRIGK